MKLAHNYFAYIVQFKDGCYYKGIINKLERRRTGQHNEGRDIFSFIHKRRMVTLNHYERFTDVKQAIAREKQLKGWSRAKKEACSMKIMICWENLLRARIVRGQRCDPSASSG
jgi:putative endonuclease